MLDLEQGKEEKDGKFRVQRIIIIHIINGKEEFLVRWFELVSKIHGNKQKI